MARWLRAGMPDRHGPCIGSRHSLVPIAIPLSIINHRTDRGASLLTVLSTLLLVINPAALTTVHAAGRSRSTACGGGGAVKGVEARVTGCITSIDYATRTLVANASY